ncbi:DUF6427 family protein [Psychroserpens algicola]|uniref:DUF6427 family protein n=1 Tax=Psychroserpens algicola TaxID=1719034 RepID=A0ABT0HBQ5_9FLAO|nr:DUF6427 family protein [Psychroserpens algicola]MCK8481804.1 DUF6427 family protein [Psychroserpens algicola]
MISNFFSKSKPIHYIVVSIILLVVFVLSKLNTFSEGIDIYLISKQTGLFLVCLFSVFVFDFLVTRNSLTKKNSYNIVLYVLFFAMLPQAILNSEIIFANLFVLLALRRLISLRTQKDIKKKLFDASFWIAVATLFYFWSWVFFALIFIALLTYGITDIKNYIIPLIGIATVGVITICYLIIFNVDILDFAHSLFDYSLDYTTLNSKQVIVASTLLLSFGLWALFYYIKNIKSQMKSYRPSFKLIIITAVLALLIVVFAPSKNGSEFIFLFAPLSIIMTNYLEVISENWFKETLLWTIILTPIALLML